ncbi:MAG: hypothetical protein M1837_000825 [Sclerophora amabilis]|nr:MAG: hypothetical protein M1837_000825 [Sclerophora amabilis]
MGEKNFVESLEDLTGRVAIVTGGASGIGLETTIYLAQRGATVYVASRNRVKSEKGIAEAEERLRAKGKGKGGGVIKYHHLDLSTMAGAKESAESFKTLESRLDIIVANAGISFEPQDELSSDGWEKVFATNHLGHFVFITTLLNLVETTANAHGQARIVAVSSIGYTSSKKIDYDALRTKLVDDGQSIWGLGPAFNRYVSSKLANVYFMTVLDTKLQEKGVKNVYCNSCHPGINPTTGLGEQGGIRYVGSRAAWLVRSLLYPFGNSVIDGAKTPTYLAASEEVRNREVHGEFWRPTWSWTWAFTGSRKQELTPLARDEEEQRKLWIYSREAVQEAIPQR